jgi:hypothetical protein
MIPMLHTSIAGFDYSCPYNNSGDIYFRDPAFTFSGFKPLVEPNIPKSTNFKSKSKFFYYLPILNY